MGSGNPGGPRGGGGGPGGRPGGGAGGPPQPPDEVLQGLARAVRTGIDEEFIGWAEAYGKAIAGKDSKIGTWVAPSRSITSSQIRNVYGEVVKERTRIELDSRDEAVSKERLLMLIPLVRYAGARDQSGGIDRNGLPRILDLAIHAIFENGAEGSASRFLRFARGLEAVLAYHKAFGGK